MRYRLIVRLVDGSEIEYPRKVDASEIRSVSAMLGTSGVYRFWEGTQTASHFYPPSQIAFVSIIPEES